MTPDERLMRDLRRFARLHVAALDADDATRLSVESLCRRVNDGGLTAPDMRSCLDQIDELLVMGEVARRHR